MKGRGGPHGGPGNKSMRTTDLEKLPYRPAVGVMLANPAGQVFVGQRIDSPGPAWQMPQGGIDGDEDPRSAALRELEEETGIAPELVTIEAEHPRWLTYDLPPELVPKVWNGRFRGQKQRWFLMRFHGTDDQVNIATAHPEFSTWAWVEPDEVVERIVPFKRDLYEQVLDAFAKHLR